MTLPEFIYARQHALRVTLSARHAAASAGERERYRHTVRRYIHELRLATNPDTADFIRHAVAERPTLKGAHHAN